jgi:hypothetical protein
MAKYKIFKNKRTKFHPSIDIRISIDKKWENIEITSHPVRGKKYIKFSKNPNKNWKNRDAYFRKYIRKDPISAKGEEFKNYELSQEDECKVDEFLAEKKKAGQLLTDKGAKRLNQIGNQANHQKLGQTPFENIKAKRKRNRKKKR